jgi:hypothetical protein
MRWIGSAFFRILKRDVKQEDRPPTPKIGEIIDALESVEDTATFRRLQDRLALQLFRLTPADAEQLSRKQKRALRRQLQFSLDTAWPVYRDVPFVLALLQGVSMFDDVETLKIVTRLAEESPQPQVRQAAIACQAILEERVESRGLHRRLVRSSANPLLAPDALLRPAPHSEHAAERLVRPSDGE